ncbi:hypothetical protein LLY23_11435 [Morganella morganii]|uniref:hypothetical protein n=1 Tax=Morganella morganii TaxID=582 RepID=UPI0007DB894D|nr:hypothetical protein [Morganella morganii]HDS2912216.1 hypothetical protein [Morganella morganii subsp. morganii]EME8469124.1 hypothetical protein [Morganella morganii]MBA5852704.1 hypothetical protein [Morganella morganii]OAS00657.1 hypothetical protein AYO06_08360 [Morganella morganii]UEH02454.1 hypothetical protein LLY23_11435 [Morganella morganii]
MPIYEMEPEHILPADVNAMQQPEPVYGNNEKPSWYAPLNPLDDSNETKRLRDAAFRIDNSVGSLIATIPFNQFEAVEGYNPFEDDNTLAGYEDYADAFIHSQSPLETSAIKQRIDRQIQDRTLLAEAGGAGFTSSLAMGVIDPINVAATFIPGGLAVRGGSVARTAGTLALSNAGAGVLSETALSATQETRTLTESALNVTFDATLGGVMGSAIQLVKNRGALAAKFRNDVIGEQQTQPQNIPNNIPGDRNIGAAEVFDTTLEQEAIKGPSFVNRTMNVSPVGRVAQSPSKIARQVNQQLAENNFTYAKNEEGIASFGAVETAVRRFDALVYKQVESTRDYYKQYKQAARTGGDTRMSHIEFSEAVGDAMRNGDQHAIPQVAEAARAIRPIVEQTKNHMVELGILREGVKVTTAESYFPRIYKFDKILSDRSEFKKVIADWLGETSQIAVNKAQGSLDKAVAGIERAENARPAAEKLGAEIREAESWSGKKTELLSEVDKNIRLIGEKQAVADELSALRGLDKQTKKQAKRQAQLERKLSAIDSAEQSLPKLQRHLEILDKPRQFRNEYARLSRHANSLTRFDRRRQAAMRRMEPMAREELEAAADDIINKIIGAPAGIVPGELIPDGLTKHAGFTKARTLNIPDERIKDFLESDVNYVMENYIRQVAPEIELTKRFGRVDMDGQIKAITEDYNRLISEAATPKERAKLEKRREADLRDIRAMRDRLLGTYGAPKDPASFFVRAGRVARHVNFLRLLGGMTISSLPDMARPIMQHGLRSALKPLGKMMTDISKMRIAKADLREMGIGLEYALSSRSKVIADLNDPYSRRSFLERGLEWSSQKFGNFTLMNQYTDTMKMWSGLITQSKVLNAANAVAGGKKLSKKEITKLAHIGIDESMLHRIADQYSRHGEDLDGLLTGHSHLWDDRVVREAFQSAILKDVRTTVITPGIGDTPLMMSSELGKIVMQFKTFFFATHNRALVSGIQSGDASFYYGALLQVGLGSLVYVLKSMMAGREINTDPANLVKEGLDWSGMMGWLGEPNNVLENLSGGTYGMSAMFGGPPASRYQSRNGIGALLGPTFDLGGDIKNITAGVLNGEFDDREVRSVRKLLPFQNLFYLAPLLNQVEEQMK